MVFLLTVPSSIGLVVLGRMIIAAVYQGGRFNAYDTHQTALALSCYAVGLAGYAASKVLNPAFYALKDSRTPMWISIISIAVNYAAASFMVHRTELGHAGLALTTSTVALFSFLSQFWILRNRIDGIHGRALASSFVKILFASLAMGTLVAGLSIGVETYLGTTRWPSIIGLLVCLPAGLAVFWIACRAMRVPELEMAVEALPGPIRRLVGRGGTIPA
jgi:putative peptidoglycan lipid II flippase